MPSPTPSPELEDIPELSHLTTTSQVHLTHAYSPPHPTIVQESTTVTASADGTPSPTSFGSSLSPSLLHDSIALSDSEPPLSPSQFAPYPSAVTPDQQYPWEFNNQSSDLMSHPFIRPFSSDSVPSSSLGPPPGPPHPRSRSSPSRHGPVASEAMLEANSRRHRHPTQYVCSDCGQTFTAQFSLKRHAQSHTDERPFVCSIPGCAQRFYNSTDCKRHEKSKKRHQDLVTA